MEAAITATGNVMVIIMGMAIMCIPDITMVIIIIVFPDQIGEVVADPIMIQIGLIPITEVVEEIGGEVEAVGKTLP